jgi:hypothetical protein
MAERAVSDTPEYELDGASNWSVPERGKLVYDCADQDSKTEILAKSDGMWK